VRVERAARPLMRALLGLLLVVCAIVVLYLHLPATWSEYALRDRLDPLTLADVHGSIWDGMARRSWLGETAMGRLSWHADPAPVLLDILHAQLHFELPRDQTVDAHVSWAADRLRVDALHAELLGSALQRFFQTIDLQPIGQLRVQVGQATFDRGIPVSLRGQAVWRQATLLGPRVPIFLGDLRVDFHVASPGIVIGTIRDFGGPVQVAGTLRMNLVGYRIDMEASPRDPLLAASLSKLGAPGANGSRRLLLRAAWWWHKHDGVGADDA
jgi:hypothetical protein